MIQKKSILFLVRLYHPHIGGVEKHMQQIIPLLQSSGFQITVITEKFDIKLMDEETVAGVRVLRIPVPKNEVSKKFYIWKWVIFNIGVFIKPDIIHVHDVFFWIIPIRWFLVFKKVFITVHGYESYPIKKRWIWMRKVSENLSNGSICVGDFMKEWYNASPTSVIYGGVSVSTKKIIAKKKSALFFGRLDNQTGVLEYVKAYNLIKKKIPEFKLTVIGEGPLLSKIPKEISVLKFSDKIDRFISQNEYIFVSRYLSMLEALVQNRKVVAVYDNPVKRDYLTMSPFKKYIEIGKDGSEIAKIVIESIKNPKKLTKKTENGEIWAKKQTWDKIIEVYLRLWGFRLP